MWDQFSRKFAWLGEITGPTRDLDVYLLNFGAYKNSLHCPSGMILTHFIIFWENIG